MTALASRAIALHEAFLKSGSFDDDSALLSQSAGWRQLERRVMAAQAGGDLDRQTSDTIAIVAHNVTVHGKEILTFQRSAEAEIQQLSAALGKIIVSSVPDRSRKREVCEKESHSYKRRRGLDMSRFTPSTGDGGSSRDVDPIRQFFIDNISNPYPTASQKDDLCRTAFITRKKLESDLTNWRRRSEWTDIMNTYCSGNKSVMKEMIEGIQSGTVDVGDEIRGRYERMKGYLEKRDEQAGEWVFKIEEMVRNGQIGDAAQVVELGEEVDGLERMVDSSDADAEGESDDDVSPSNEFRSTHVDIIKPAFHLVPMSSEGSDATSPLSSIASPTQAIPATSAVQPTWTASSGLTTNYPQLSYSRAPSTKSSYSSLSAVSGIAAQSHSRSTSGSNSLRSVSSSSSTVATAAVIDPRLRNLKRPAQAESNIRSSRSRVEEILTEEPASWVDNHSPSDAFHIGSDPAFGGVDLTPYLMDPVPSSNSNATFDANAWSSDTTFTYLPHISQPSVGAFELPPEYEFNFMPSSAK